jgi:hypothetical protein
VSSFNGATRAFPEPPDLFAGDFPEVGLLWEILPDQAVGVFV